MYMLHITVYFHKQEKNIINLFKNIQLMKHLSIQTIQMTLMCIVFSLVCEGCHAKSGKFETSMFAPIDSVIRAEVGDSISSLMLSSKTIVAERILLKNDSLSVVKKKKLKRDEISILKFLFVTTEEFRDSAVVFGKFSPSIRLTFKVSKKVFCIAYVDFGLRQIVLRDSNGKDIKKFGIKDDRYIKFANVIFPDDKFLSFMQKQY